MGADLVCSTCAFAAQDANELHGHIRNIHGWKTDAEPITTRPPSRCTYALPGLGRCVDTSGGVHGHHFKPGRMDEALVLTLEEARALVGYMRNQYVNPNHQPVLSQMLDRLDAHVTVTA
jgi:hypothetical protein